jgi:hypothetical protein
LTFARVRALLRARTRVVCDDAGRAIHIPGARCTTAGAEIENSAASSGATCRVARRGARKFPQARARSARDSAAARRGRGGFGAAAGVRRVVCRLHSALVREVGRTSGARGVVRADAALGGSHATLKEILEMRYRTLLLFVLMFASAVGAAVIPALYDNIFPALMFVGFPVFSALLFTSIVFDIMHPRPEPPRTV